MVNILDLPWDPLEIIVRQLHPRDLVPLARVSKKLNELAVLSLYPTIHFFLPGRISEADALLQQLETFTDPKFDLLKHTKRVLVSGTWYEEYDEIESDLGRDDVLSPAVRMLNSLLSICVSKMPDLKSFIWDAQVAPTQQLISMMGFPANLEYLQLRVGTNGSPTPFFHPTLEFDRYTNLRSLSVVEVTGLESLNSVGNALFFTERLNELAISANKGSRLSLGDLFTGWTGRKTLNLRTLDLRGFASLGSPPASIWDSITPSRLEELTLEIGASDRPLEDYGEFWEAAAAAGVRLTRLETNLITGGLTRFICSFSGLEALLLLPCLLGSHVFRPLFTDRC